MLTNAERAELVRDIAAEVVRQLLPYVEYGEYLTSKQVCDILNWSMATLKKHSGEAYTRSWVFAQVFNLAEMAGTDAKFCREQMEEMITLITNEYGWLKVSELMFFFLRVKQGKYGKFYGAVDFYTITEALCKFMETRHEYIAKFERETEQERETRERDESAARAQAFYAKLQAAGVTIEEWLKNPSMKLAPTSA